MPIPELLSVITPVLPARAQHLHEAAASISTLRKLFPTEWIVAVDGPASTATDLDLTVADQVVFMGSHSGTSCTRNAALSRAQGKYIVPLDADDVLDPQGVKAGISVLDENPTLGWVALNRLLLHNGKRTPHWHDEQEWPPGSLSENWTAPFPFHPNSLIVRTRLALQMGGWPATPVNEDLLFALILGEHASGRSAQEVLTFYRSWDSQEISQVDYPARKTRAFIYIESVINAIRQSQGRKAITRPPAQESFGTTILQ